MIFEAYQDGNLSAQHRSFFWFKAFPSWFDIVRTEDGLAHRLGETRSSARRVVSKRSSERYIRYTNHWFCSAPDRRFSRQLDRALPGATAMGTRMAANNPHHYLFGTCG